MDKTNNMIKVSADTNMARLSDTIYKSIIDDEEVVIRGFGEFAVYQMTKALARCKARVTLAGTQMTWSTTWETVKGEKDGKTLSALTTTVHYKKAQGKVENAST